MRGKRDAFVWDTCLSTIFYKKDSKAFLNLSFQIHHKESPELWRNTYLNYQNMNLSFSNKQ